MGTAAKSSTRRFAAALALLAALVLAPGLAAPRSSATSRAQVHTPASASAERARSLAEAQALRLLGELPLPPGSRLLSGRPSFASQLKGPATEPLARTLVDRPAFSSIPLAPAEAVEWIRVHLPAGWSESMRGSNATGGGIESWEERFLLSTTLFAEASVSLAAVAAPSGGSVVRMDAQVVWFPPRPHSSFVPAGVKAATLVFAPVRSERRSTMRPGRAIRPPLTVTDPVKVGLLAQAVNALHLPTGGAASCAAMPVTPVFVWLIFTGRSSRRPIAVVRASPIGCSGGGFVSLSVRGRLAPELDESDKLIHATHAILGVSIPKLSAGGVENMRRRARERTAAILPARPPNAE